MSYGLTVLNDSQYVQISSESPRLCKLYDGAYAGQSYFGVTFPAPINTPEPPCIFIRPNNGATVLHMGIVITGSPGQWTGFYIRLSNTNSVATGTWFAAVFRATISSSYGMKLWDAQGIEIYDTASPAVIVSSGSHNWVYAGRRQIGGGNAYYYECPIAKPFTANDHFMVNPFSRYLMTAHIGNTIPMGVSMDVPNNMLVMYAVAPGGISPWTDSGHFGSVIARIKR